MLSTLSTREREVTLLVVEGLSNKEIGRQLNISDNTVKVHLHNIYVKLEIRKRTSLAVLVAKLEVSTDRRRAGGDQWPAADALHGQGAALRQVGIGETRAGEARRIGTILRQELEP
jgi:DNA-binding CsgD family transcriptional regulator